MQPCHLSWLGTDQVPGIAPYAPGEKAAVWWAPGWRAPAGVRLKCSVTRQRPAGYSLLRGAAWCAPARLTACMCWATPCVAAPHWRWQLRHCGAVPVCTARCQADTACVPAQHISLVALLGSAPCSSAPWPMIRPCKRSPINERAPSNARILAWRPPPKPVSACARQGGLAGGRAQTGSSWEPHALGSTRRPPPAPPAPSLCLPPRPADVPPSPPFSGRP